MKHYVFRTTTDKLAESLQHIIESGDAVVADPVHVGGRDWVLLCRKGGPDEMPTPALAALDEALGRLRLSIDRLTDRLERSEREAKIERRRARHDQAGVR